MKFLLKTTIVCLLLLFSEPIRSDDFSHELKDKIHKGSGTINLLRDINASSLSSYLNTNGSLKLGVSLRENAKGNEGRDSIGIAIKNIELMLVTDAGVFSYSDIYTSTSAMIVADGSSTAGRYFTMFGSLGNNHLTSDTSNFNLHEYDDVLEVKGVNYTGSILSASLNVTFLKTNAAGGANETFFDFGGGAERFSVLSNADAATLSSARIGQDAAPHNVTFQRNESPASPPGSPAPPIAILAVAGVFALFRQRSAR